MGCNHVRFRECWISISVVDGRYPSLCSAPSHLRSPRRSTPSVAAMIYPFGGHHIQKFYWGTKVRFLFFFTFLQRLNPPLPGNSPASLHLPRHRRRRPPRCHCARQLCQFPKCLQQHVGSVGGSQRSGTFIFPRKETGTDSFARRSRLLP